MRNTILYIFALLINLNITFAQQNVLLSASAEAKPHKFEQIANENASFLMVISSEGEQEEEESTFVIFPNNTSNALFVQNEDGKTNFGVEILDKETQKIISKKNLNEITLVDLSTLKKGTYLLKIKSPTKIESHTLVLR